MTDSPEGAIIQRDGKTYAVVTRTTAGVVTPEYLERVASIARKYAVPMLKITSGQSIALIGIPEETLPSIFRDLGKDADRTSGPCLHYVQACLGTETCRFGNQDAIGIARDIDAAFRDGIYPAKLKIGVSGCPRCCGESRMRDIGIMGTSRGWTVIFGGNSGIRPRIGDVIARNLSGSEVIDLVRRLLEYYRGHAKPKERTARFMDRVGTETLKTDLLRFIPYIDLEDVKMQ
jgi:NAD(P)H-nitrite reductase large subunit